MSYLLAFPDIDLPQAAAEVPAAGQEADNAPLESVYPFMWMDDKEIRRINRLLVNAELSPPAFLISNIPLDTQWESFPAGTLLPVKHTHIRVCVIGQLHDINVLHEADMVPRAEVELTPLRETDREAMHDLLRLAVPPPSTLRLPQTLTAAKHMTAM
ncbi:hypothetical protein OH76DRAFT_1479375 [Lentinus brumalis]|uniref:Uncharacterized protein n=1 Tax=Lentinus brumalis TaxID=2498619 RepID=A0A371DPF0_9APHY|nr:hypothetical protein OH76DRAFT_1479375 [Polyporus brumalis]